MKKESGTIGGFIFGMGGFLALFKVLILDHTPPSDELAPGIVVLASILNGILFAFVGRMIQRHLGNRSTPMESK